MLETVKSDISKGPFISFGQYFTQYVFDVQDQNIESEANTLFKYNHIDYKKLNEVIDDEMGGDF